MIATPTTAATQNGLLAEWNFDEGQGEVARDSSGNGHDIKMTGPSWEKQGDGFLIRTDGIDDFAECGSSKELGIIGPITIEMWIKPLRKGNGLACVLGEDLRTYLLTYYNTAICQLYIGDGSNNVGGKVQLGEWKHLAACFDGKTMSMWINGRMTGSRESSGVYDFAGGRDLHLVRKFDTRGAPVEHDYITTSDSSGVRTEPKFDRHESAVIEPIAATLQSAAALNIRVIDYSPTALRLIVNGKGDAALNVRSGILPIAAGETYNVAVGGETTQMQQKDGSFTVPMKLEGSVEVRVERAPAK